MVSLKTARNAQLSSDASSAGRIPLFCPGIAVDGCLLARLELSVRGSDLSPVTLDGKPVSGDGIPLSEDEHTHDVLVIIG
jgi:hypothetical protein